MLVRALSNLVEGLLLVMMVVLCVDVDGHRIDRRLETRYLDEVAGDLDDAIARCDTAKRDRRALSAGTANTSSSRSHRPLAARPAARPLICWSTCA